MTVIETIKKYGLEDYSKTYNNQYGSFTNLLPLNELAQMEVKGIAINFPTNQVTITVIQRSI